MICRSVENRRVGEPGSSAVQPGERQTRGGKTNEAQEGGGQGNTGKNSGKNSKQRTGKFQWFKLSLEHLCLHFYTFAILNVGNFQKNGQLYETK